MDWRATTSAAVVAILLSMACSAGPVNAQESAAIEGRIIAEDGGGVPAAQVIAVETATGIRFGGVSDANGRFRLQGMTPGVYRLDVRAVGRQPRSVSTVEVRAGESRSLVLVLNTDPIVLQGVDVTGVSRSRFEETYAATRVEGTVDGAEASAFNPANPYDALRLVPGVTYASGSRFGKPARIRGASSWATADVIEDFPSVREAGIGAEDGGFTADFGAMIPAIALAGIEVKKGSLGVLYGGDADGGVIVNHLRRGAPGGALGASLEASPLGETLYMVDAGTASGAFDVYAAGKLLEGDYQEFVDERGRELATDDLRSGLIRAGWEPLENVRFEFIGVGGRDRIRYSLPQRDDPSTPADESRTLEPQYFRTTNASGFYGATFDHAVSSVFGYEAGYSLFRQRALRFSITEDRAHRDRPETTHTGFGNAYWNLVPSALVDASFRAGIEWTRHRQAEQANDNNKVQRFEDRAAFGAVTLSLGRTVTLSGGARRVAASDDYRPDQNFWVYDLGAAYEFRPTRTRLIASRSTGYSRFKGFAYFFGNVAAAGGYDVARTATIEGSVEQTLPTASGDGQVTATIFRLDTSGIPIFAGSGAGGIITQDTRAKGVELSADLPLGPVGVSGSFSWQDAEVVATDHPEGLNVGNTAGWIPRYSAALGLSAAPHPEIDVSLMSVYDDGRRQQTLDPLTDDVSVATSHAFMRVNAAAAWWVVPRMAFRVRLENLLDEKDLGYSVQTVGPDGSLSTTESVALDPGCVLFVGFEFRYR